MEGTKKLGWLEQLKIACLKPREYPRLLQVATGRVVVFFIVFSFLITFLGVGVDMIGFTVSVGGTRNFILNRLPDFELKDGVLEMDGRLNFEIGGIHIAADTSQDKVDTDDFSTEYAGEIYFAKDEAMLRMNYTQPVTYRITFSDHKDVVYNNQKMLSLIPAIRLFMVLMFLMTWIVQILMYLFLCLFISMFVFMNQRVRNEAVSFGKVFRLSIYARVVFSLIETIGSTAGIAFFSGSVWMIISYLGSYQLLGMAFVRTEKKSEKQE